MIRTLDDARKFVLEVKVCTIFGSRRSPYPSLWEHVDLPDKQPGEGGWGQRITAVWEWKTALPARFPEEIFYGKVAGGDAVLMELNHMREVHYPAAHRPASTLNELARALYEAIRIEPWLTGDLRKWAMERTGCTKSQFDSALKHLQITLNIVRSNHPDDVRDKWLPFTELYPELRDD